MALQQVFTALAVAVMPEATALDLLALKAQYVLFGLVQRVQLEHFRQQILGIYDAFVYSHKKRACFSAPNF